MEPAGSAGPLASARRPAGAARLPQSPLPRPRGANWGARGVLAGRGPAGGGRHGAPLPWHRGRAAPQAEVQAARRAQGARWPALGHGAGRPEQGRACWGGAWDRPRRGGRVWGREAQAAMASWAGGSGTLGQRIPAETPRREGHLQNSQPVTWKEFIRTHMDVLVATDFFTAEVWTLGGLVTYYVLFFLHLSSRKVHVAGVTPHPNEAWMMQVARHVTMEEWSLLSPGQYLIHDCDTKFCTAFQQTIDDAGVERVVLPPRSPNLNAYAERWVRSVKDEALSRLMLFGEASLRHALHEYVEHYHHERNHQGKDNVRLFPTISQDTVRAGPLQCRERLGGLLKYYECEAA